MELIFLIEWQNAISELYGKIQYDYITQKFKITQFNTTVNKIQMSFDGLQQSFLLWNLDREPTYDNILAILKKSGLTTCHMAAFTAVECKDDDDPSMTKGILITMIVSAICR